MKKTLPYIFAIILIFGAFAHIIVPEFYSPMIPAFIPESFANIASFITELSVGILLFIPKYRHWGGLGFTILMIGFMPIHIWDFLKNEPAIGSKGIAAFRIIMQLAMIYAGWWIFRTYKKES
ncbi:MAG: hypothetical protein MK078_17140 [Crocinitomicaceae bacterium]|nr:hypothetical protein [Crocinitomicaceae bacterium]